MGVVQPWCKDTCARLYTVAVNLVGADFGKERYDTLLGVDYIVNPVSARSLTLTCFDEFYYV